MNQFCAVCGKSAIQTCSACNSIYYCSKEHQKSHWKNHKNSCAPFKINQNEDGKTIISIRNIEAGEKLLTKLPLIIGPQSDKELPCITCFKKIENNKNSQQTKCAKCGIMVCGKICLDDNEHLKICELLCVQNLTVEKCGNLHKFLLPLKLLMLKSEDFKKFDTIASNYSYEEHREILPKNLLTEFMKMCEKLGISKNTNIEELSKLYIISKRNFLDIAHRKSKNIKGFYVIIPYLKQNCMPNTKRVFLEDANQLSIFATRPIKKGEILTTNFAEQLWGTTDRQNFLKNSKFINCNCERCEDPKEFKTYLNSIYCQKCKDKLLVDNSPKILSLNPLDLESEWKCEKCDYQIQGKQIAFGNKCLEREISSQTIEQPKNLEHFLFKYGEILHPTNSYSLRVKIKLIQLYGNSEGFKLNEIPDELLERKIQLCYELLEIADILDPGFSKLRGILNFELQAAMVIQTKRNFCKELLTKSEAEDKLRKSLDLLHESCKCLLVEPEFKEKLENANKILDLLD